MTCYCKCVNFVQFTPVSFSLRTNLHDSKSSIRTLFADFVALYDDISLPCYPSKCSSASMNSTYNIFLLIPCSAAQSTVMWFTIPLQRITSSNWCHMGSYNTWCQPLAVQEIIYQGQRHVWHIRYVGCKHFGIFEGIFMKFTPWVQDDNKSADAFKIFAVIKIT